MSINISTINSAYATQAAYSKSKTEANSSDSNTASLDASATTTTVNTGFSEEAAVYEPSQEATSSVTDRSAIIAQLKADNQKQIDSMKDMAMQMITGQGQTLSSADDIWSFLASGDYTVTEAAKKQAQEAISEDGYWGVEQTSQRIVDFAKALAGDDSSKADELLEAFKEGYSQATKTWGKELPDISKSTYEAVEKKFEEWKNSSETTDSSELMESSGIEDITTTI